MLGLYWKNLVSECAIVVTAVFDTRNEEYAGGKSYGRFNDLILGLECTFHGECAC